jgi:hypothetical protein
MSDEPEGLTILRPRRELGMDFAAPKGAKTSARAPPPATASSHCGVLDNRRNLEAPNRDCFQLREKKPKT